MSSDLGDSSSMYRKLSDVFRGSNLYSSSLPVSRIPSGSFPQW